MESQGGKRTRGRERRFTVEEVLGTALHLIDDEGLEALTMRRLAEALGVTAMSLYSYVRTKEEIVDGVYALALGQIESGVDRTAAWDEQLATAIRRIHTAFRDHPGLLELFFARSVPSAGIDRVREELLGILRRAGFSSHDALLAHGSCISYAMGFAVAERARRGGPDPAQYIQAESLPADEYPFLTEAAADYATHLSGDAFEYGLTHLIAGLRTDLES
jgi:AcrR family transcriptional regulator